MEHAGVPEWSKGPGSGPGGAGLRGFESRPPHYTQSSIVAKP